MSSPLHRGFSQFAVRVHRAVAQPSAFVLATSLILVWLGIGPFVDWNDTWQLWINTMTTIITFLMVFVLHHAQTLPTTPVLETRLMQTAGRPTRFTVEYTYARPNGSRTRTRLSTSVSQLPTPGKSESVVLAYLKRRHPGLDVVILYIEWEDATGQSV